CEPIRETGICACCMTCALRLGDACGVRTEKCGDGLQCRPLLSETLSPLESLLAGRGICQGAR
ncbi:Insulin-like growth factor-binding protein 3, partial [Lamellibrachia satsuma]